MFKKCVVFNSKATLNGYICFSNCLTNRLAANSAPILNHVDVVQNILGCTETEAINGLINHGDLLKLSGNELLQRLGILQEIGLADLNETDCLGLAKHHPATLKNRIMSLQECGFQQDKITSITVKKFLTLTHLQIQTLKDLLFIEKKTDVYKQLLAHAQVLEHYSPVCEELNIATIKKQMLKLLLKHEIGMPDEKLGENSEILNRLKNKSIRVIRKNINLAKNVIGLSPYRICRNPFILWADPDNTLKILDEIKEIGGVDIKLCISLYPKLILSPYKNFIEIIDCLKEFNFSDAAIQKGICLFTLSSITIRKRLNDLEEDEYFRVCKQHPRVLMLIYYFNKVKQRLYLLKELNINNATVNTITSGCRHYFKRYYEHGSLRQSGLDIIKYVCAELECEKSEFRYKVRDFPLWIYAPTIEIAKNLMLLKERGFTKQEIFNCVHILFYQRTKIIEVLNSLDQIEGLECCKDNGLIKKEFILPLVIYFIEKSQNFATHSLCASPEEEEQDTHSDIILPEYSNKKHYT